MKKIVSILCAAMLVSVLSCARQTEVVMGDERFGEYLPALEGKRVALFTNHTGLVGSANDSPHILDVLLEKGVDVRMVFSPEHGFRGTADAGEKVESGRDPKTGVQVVSLYGAKISFDPGFDVLLVDIQDVGLRFYTYYITLMRLMEVCAQDGKPMIILDRPNPNGFKVDGPILDPKHKSGVGALPIPVMHGMTLGELAQMIAGEGWLGWPKASNVPEALDLTVIPCLNYTHATLYELPVAPSPNLKDMQAVYLYPSTCLFEGTKLSLGRGTLWPFEMYGHPDFPETGFTFTPQPMPGAMNPPLKGRACKGVDLRDIPQENIRAEGINLGYVTDAYHRLGEPADFFRRDGFFEKLIGVDYVREMIGQGADAAEIEAKWAPDVEKFSALREKYQIYD